MYIPIFKKNWHGKIKKDFEFQIKLWKAKELKCFSQHPLWPIRLILTTFAQNLQLIFAKKHALYLERAKKKRINRNFVSTFFIYALLLLLSYLILQITVVDIKRIFTKRFIRHAASAPTHTPAHILTVWSQWLQQAWGQH